MGFLLGLGTMGGADYIAIVGRVAKSTAQDASQVDHRVVLLCDAVLLA